MTNEQNPQGDAETLRQVLAQRERELKKALEECDEARSWARHGYEIGQRSTLWSDHGVAPKWLTEGFGL